MSHWLVKYRRILFLLMTVLAIVSALAVPSIQINTDMTRYLPDEYPMKQGLDLMEEQLPALQQQMQEFGTLFASGDDFMPTNLPQILAIGVGLLFVVLLFMCSSVMEVGLFLLAIGFAVVLNMGTNALLPSVSMITNILTPVLQMILSMDYSIILMNRYRQEKVLGKDPEKAMEGAIGGAASSIVSSALTTIVSLMMLCFIKLKIGADLGLVLSKGVCFSLLCNFTVLPFLILAFDKAVEATRKKVPVFPAAPVSHFAYRFRYPLTVLFVLIFVGFAYLQRNTPLSFSPQWESTALNENSKENAALLLYPNVLEGNLPDLMDTLAALPWVEQAISYPSLIQRPRTAREMVGFFSEMAPERASDLPTDLLSLVYYARFNPERNERMSFDEMMDLMEDLSNQGLVPEGYELNLDMNAFLEQPEPVAPVQIALAHTDTPVAEEETPLEPEPEPVYDPVSDPDSEHEPELESESEPRPDSDPATADSVHTAQPTSRFTYEDASTPRTAAEMAHLMQFNARQLSMLYRMAGRRNQAMTPKEMLDFVQNRILADRRYSKFVSKEMAQKVVVYKREIDSILIAGPAPVITPMLVDTLFTAELADTLFIVDSSFVEEPVALQTVIEQPIVEVPPTPMEILADMAFSHQRYTSEQVYTALSNADIEVTQAQLDLLFLYSGARDGADSTWKLSVEALLDFVADILLNDPALESVVPDSARLMVALAREEMLQGVGQLRGENYSGAVLLSTYAVESDSTFAFVDQLRSLADAYLPTTHYWIGESEMYKELKEGFPSELLLLTLLTVLSIFLIVAVNFRSVFIPIPLVMTIMSGVYVNIWASGLGGGNMYYLSYLIVQGILMGATIDYTILFTHYFLEARKRLQGVEESLTAAYNGSSHSILTSGLILVIVPAVLCMIIDDAMIAGILRSLSIGATAILTLTLFVLPGVLAIIKKSDSFINLFSM